MWTLAKANVRSRATCRAAAPGANGLSTRSTWGPFAIVASVRWILAFVAGAVTSAAPKTTWFVSVDSALKLSVRRLSAVVDSVPGSENESVYPDPALALSPPMTISAATQTAMTRNLCVKHQRARALIATQRMRPARRYGICSVTREPSAALKPSLSSADCSDCAYPALVNVAPLTASMSALCALSASCFRVGSAKEEISAERGSLPVSTRPWMAVILPSLTVTRTWTGPYCVSIASPVAVPETALDEEPDDPELPLPLPGAALDVLLAGAAAVAAVVGAVAVGAADACGWKASTPAVPATVAARTMGERRIGGTPSQKVKDSKRMRPLGTPARFSSRASWRDSASGPHM